LSRTLPRGCEGDFGPTVLFWDHVPRQGNRGQDFDSRVRVFEALRY
jgi:hypothetical protein